jgi:hypothetical protein
MSDISQDFRSADIFTFRVDERNRFAVAFPSPTF